MARCSASFFSSLEKWGEKKNTAKSRFSWSASTNWPSSSCALHALLASLPGLRLGFPLVDLARLAGPIDDLIGLAAGGLQALTVVGQQVVGLVPDPLGVLD